MHISEGVLPGWCLGVGWVLTAGGLYLGLRSINGEKIPRTALLSAAFFIASLIHVPIGVTSVHLLLNGLAGALLGWAVFPALFVALLFQAFLFQFGQKFQSIAAIKSLIFFGKLFCQKKISLGLFCCNFSKQLQKPVRRFIANNIISTREYLQ